jgi:predicted permease
LILFTHELQTHADSGNKKSTIDYIITLLRTLLLNPIILSSVGGFIVAQNQVVLPSVLRDIITFVGTPSISLALFALGLSLSNEEYNRHVKNRDIYFLIFAKNFIQPLAAFLVGRYIFHVPDAWLAPLVICAALPTAVHNYVFAEKYGQFQAESRDVVFYTSLLSLPVITILFTILR